MNYREMSDAVEDAQRTMNLVDSMADRFARMLIGRLRKVNSCWVLAELKRELKDYNIHTGQWK